MSKLVNRGLILLVLLAGVGLTFNLIPRAISDLLTEHASLMTFFLSLLAFFGIRQDLKGHDKAGAVVGLLIALAAIISLIAQGYVFNSWPISAVGVVVLLLETWLLKRWWPSSRHQDAGARAPGKRSNS